MDFNDLYSITEKLQRDIASSVHKLVEQFKQDTGVSPNSIQINMTHLADRLTLFGRIPEYIVGKAKVDLDIPIIMEK